ncbi:MAG: HAD-IIA family hydrolase [Prolixibacteraceae bacterium]
MITDSLVHVTAFKTKKMMLERLRKVKHVALDMDGTIYNGDTLFPYTKNFLNSLDEMGISYSFLTNNPSRSTTDYLSHLSKMGLKVSENEIYTSAHATISYLTDHYPDVQRIFFLGTPSMISEFEQAGFHSVADDPMDEPDAVVVGFDPALSYARLTRAAWWIRKKKIYLATNPDYVCPTDQPVVLIDCGSICAALEKATGRTPDVVLGKPDPEMLHGIKRGNGLKQEEIAMVGDRIYTDLLMAQRANALGVLVLSGESTLQDVDTAGFVPDIVTDSIESFGELLIRSHATVEETEN